MVLKTYIIKMSELKLRSNRWSGGGDAYSLARRESQLGTLQCGQLRSQRLTDLAKMASFIGKFGGTTTCMCVVTKM